ncbi:hypothetical protein ACFX2A_024647 [Malus domestica]
MKLAIFIEFKDLFYRKCNSEIRRKSIVLDLLPQQGDPSHGLGKAQILELFQNCIKLASENKINQKNTWELNLIDHLTDIINVEEEKAAETNFQKASCTLEGGVKIYSMRVDSVHSEAYKVLGGMNRVGQGSEQDTRVEDANADHGKDAASSKNETYSPLSTLESFFEALNVRKFDVAFAVDRLYHQTAAQSDEGGAKGLLMTNLGVYGGCRVLFDSSEVPGKHISSDNQLNKSDTIDLSFAGEYVEQMSNLMLPLTMKLILIVMYLRVAGTGIMIMMTSTVKVQISLVIMRFFEHTIHIKFES